MHVLKVRNVNGAFRDGTLLLLRDATREESRAGSVLVSRAPVTTVYMRPMERVLFHSARDANPVFHLMESLWMLAGRNDARWLDQFVSDFSARFAEADGIQHGAYGYRWRNHFGADQLDVVVELLKANPSDRRAVITMWDPPRDLGADKKDVPCNTHIYPRVRGGYLDITVCCRSNDAVWGAYGANAVHFSVLQEYLAARLGLYSGTYYQISNNFHVYEAVLEKLALAESSLWTGHCDLYADTLVKATPIVTDPERFDQDLSHFFDVTAGPTHHAAYAHLYRNAFFPEIAVPLFIWYKRWRAGDRVNFELARETDWSLATAAWAVRRMTGKEKRK